MRKTHRTPEELEELYGRTLEMEMIYNQIPPLETHIRTIEREIELVYPESFLKIVYEALGEELHTENN